MQGDVYGGDDPAGYMRLTELNPKWLDNAIQFPRFIAEAEAAGAFTPEIISFMCESMDITINEWSELIDRAQIEWELIKSQTRHPSNG